MSGSGRPNSSWILLRRGWGRGGRQKVDEGNRSVQKNCDTEKTSVPGSLT
jgi:hypothetical protein